MATKRKTTKKVAPRKRAPKKTVKKEVVEVPRCRKCNKVLQGAVLVSPVDGLNACSPACAN